MGILYTKLKENMFHGQKKAASSNCDLCDITVLVQCRVPRTFLDLDG